MGSFDGVHQGHIKILNEVTDAAQRLGLTSVVASFDPHPREVITGISPNLLSPGEERTRLLQALPINSHVLFAFDDEIASMEAEDFVREVLVEMFSVQVLVVGYDHRFGKNRSGNVDVLRSMGLKYGFSVVECPEVEVEGETVSSSAIRAALSRGDVANARQLIGREYSIDGSVIHGAGRGRTIGIPTANIGLIPAHKLIPKDGVYAVRLQVLDNGSRWDGMMNIGLRPTFEDTNAKILEVNLFDFDQDLYDREVRVEFIERIRDERKFDSAQHLIEQLNEDRERCITLLRLNP